MNEETTETTAMLPYHPRQLEQLEMLSVKFAKSGLVPAALQGKPQDVMLILLQGHEMGLTPMQALRGLDVINGVVAIRSALLIAQVKQHPDCVYFRLVESSDQKATYETERDGEGKTSLTYTVQQAAQAGLMGRDNWKRHTADMLRARCAKKLALVVYPDVAFGLMDTDEAAERDLPPPPEKELNDPPAGGAVTQGLKEKLAAKLAEDAQVVPGFEPVVAESKKAKKEESARKVEAPKAEEKLPYLCTKCGHPTPTTTGCPTCDAKATAPTGVAVGMTPYQLCLEHGALFGMPQKQVDFILRTKLKKASSATLVPTDVTAFKLAVDAVRAAEANEPPLSDADAPVGA